MGFPVDEVIPSEAIKMQPSAVSCSTTRFDGKLWTFVNVRASLKNRTCLAASRTF